MSRTFIDHQPLPKPVEMRMQNMRVAVFKKDRTAYIGLGNLADEEYHHSPTEGAGVYTCLHMDDTSILYDSDCFWMPVEQLTDELKEKFNIQIDD